MVDERIDQVIDCFHASRFDFLSFKNLRVAFENPARLKSIELVVLNFFKVESGDRNNLGKGRLELEGSKVNEALLHGQLSEDASKSLPSAALQKENEEKYRIRSR